MCRNGATCGELVRAAPHAGVTHPTGDFERVLVCGLGALGSECARTLRGYGIEVHGVDCGTPDLRGLAGMPLVSGDCRELEVLKQAGIDECRAVVLVTNDARTNIEAAMASRKLKPTIRIVARAGGHRLSELLRGFLGDFVAYEPSELAAGALALAALGSDVIGQFHVEGRLVRVIRHEVGPADRWRGVAVKRVTSTETVLLDHDAKGASTPVPALQIFHDFDPERKIDPGDLLTLMTIEQEARAERHDETDRGSRRDPTFSWRERWQGLGRPAHVVVGALGLITLAVLLSIVVFPWGEPTLSRADAFFTALVLMTGGTYADLFPAFNHLPNALRLLSVALSLIGTLAVGLAYAWFTDRLMTWRLRLVPRRPPPPRVGHVVVAGLGDVGQHAAVLLEELGRPVAAIAPDSPPERVVPQVPVVIGDATDNQALTAANVAGARGVLAATSDDWTNLEIALRARQLNPSCSIVIRARDVRFSEHVANVLSDLQVLCVPLVAARAFAGAALGSRVLGLFRLRGRTVYAVQYRVEAGGGLDGRPLGELAEGYDLLPVWHEPRDKKGRFCSVGDLALRVAPGDRLIVLATSSSLRAVEQGQLAPRAVRLVVTARRPFSEPLALASALVKHLGCSLEQAHAALAMEPSTIPEPLYPHQAHRLRSALETAGAVVELRDAATGP